MRPILAALSALLATPAAAQDIDTTRTGIVETSRGFTCQFAAIPALTLADGSKDDTEEGEPIVEWSSDPTGKAVNYAPKLSIFIRRAPPGSRERYTIRWATFVLPALNDAVASATLALDRTRSVAIPANRGGDYFNLPIPAAVASRLFGSGTARLDLLDAKGAVVATSSWSIDKLRHAPAVLERVDWRCKGPATPPRRN